MEHAVQLFSSELISAEAVADALAAIEAHVVDSCRLDGEPTGFEITVAKPPSLEVVDSLELADIYVVATSANNDAATDMQAYFAGGALLREPTDRLSLTVTHQLANGLVIRTLTQLIGGGAGRVSINERTRPPCKSTELRGNTFESVAQSLRLPVEIHWQQSDFFILSRDGADVSYTGAPLSGASPRGLSVTWPQMTQADAASRAVAAANLDGGNSTEPCAWSMNCSDSDALHIRALYRMFIQAVSPCDNYEITGSIRAGSLSQIEALVDQLSIVQPIEKPILSFSLDNGAEGSLDVITTCQGHRMRISLESDEEVHGLSWLRSVLPHITWDARED